MADSLNAWLLALAQTLLFAAGAPLLAAWIKRAKCRLQNRRAPSLLQPYRDLAKLFRKQVVLAENASPLFRMTPYIVFAATLLAVAAVPLLSTRLPTAAVADMIVLVGFLAIGRFFLALAGMDIGTAFGGMGASREVSLASLAEPALLMVIFTLAMSAHSTNLSSVVQHIHDAGLVLRPSLLFALLGLLLVAVAETGRIPVDNPATHLELTMVHEAMILEYSGRHLALLEWAAQLKLMLYGVLVVNLFVPWGIAVDGDAAALAVALFAVVVKLALVGVLLAFAETALAKMRLFMVPQFLNLAFLLALLGALSYIILETGV